jgi:hypothetical protein
VRLVRDVSTGTGAVSLDNSNSNDDSNDNLDGKSLSYVYYAWPRAHQVLLAIDVTKASSDYYRAMRHEIKYRYCSDASCLLTVRAYSTTSADTDTESDLCQYDIRIFRDHYTLNLYYSCRDSTYDSRDGALFLLEWSRADRNDVDDNHNSNSNGKRFVTVTQGPVPSSLDVTDPSSVTSYFLCSILPRLFGTTTTMTSEWKETTIVLCM